jgi:Fe-Mn family superoxide dismutase
MNNNSRRKFIKNTALGTAAISIGSSAMGAFLPSSNKKITAQNKPFNTGLLQLPLPYAYDALEDIIDAKTMEIHYSKHAASYSKSLVEAVKEAGCNSAIIGKAIYEGLITLTDLQRYN